MTYIIHLNKLADPPCILLCENYKREKKSKNAREMAVDDERDIRTGGACATAKCNKNCGPAGHFGWAGLLAHVNMGRGGPGLMGWSDTKV